MTGFKTFGASALLMLMGLLEQINVADMVPDQYDGMALAAAGLLMAVLRFFTRTPPGKAE